MASFTAMQHVKSLFTMMAQDPSSPPAAAQAPGAPVEQNVVDSSLVDAVMPHGLVVPAPPAASTFPSGTSEEGSVVPLTTAELRDHMIALYNTSDSIRKYVKTNGIMSKRTTLSSAMAESGLAKRKQANFPFDKSILKLIDDYCKTYSTRKSVNAKMGRTDLKEHLLAMYTTSDSIRKYCKDHNLSSRRSTMTRAFADSGLATKKEAKEPMDENIVNLVEVYLNKQPSLKAKPVEAAKKPPKIAMKTARQTFANKNAAPPDEVQMEYSRSVLRTTPPGKSVEVVKDESTSEVALRDMKDPDRWWLVNPAGGVPLPVNTSDLLKWTVKRPDAGLKETPNIRGIPLVVEDMAKEMARTERQVRVDAVFCDANDKLKQDWLERIANGELKDKLKGELKDVNLLQNVKDDIQVQLDAPFSTTVLVTHEGKAKAFDVTMGGMNNVTVKPKESPKKRKAAAAAESWSKAAAAKQQKTTDTHTTTASLLGVTVAAADVMNDAVANRDGATEETTTLYGSSVMP